MKLNPMSSAPKGGHSKMIAHPEWKWVHPPTILLAFNDGKFSVAQWHWHYAERGYGHAEAQGCDAWWDVLSGQLVELHYGKPIGWHDLNQLTGKENSK